jgi:hypothetical protein
MKLGVRVVETYSDIPLSICATMTRPRSSLISTSDTRWYHCVSRCVRRAFLCGADQASGQSFEHRRTWVTDRLVELNGLFAIDVAAYAVMSNHYHLVLHIAPERATSWSDDDVLLRWSRLFVGPQLVRRYLAQTGPSLDRAELDRVHQYAAVFRQRLQDLSWYLRVLNQSISRKANAEDNCSGRFWEGRFKSQALLDAPALISAMIYVDLNPVRAGMVATLEESLHTSIHARLQSVLSSKVDNLLMPFDATGRTPWAIPFGLEDYITLADWTGRQQRPGKRGVIAKSLPPILQHLGLDQDTFLAMSGQMLKTYGSAIGMPSSMAEHCARRELKYLRGVAALQGVSSDS